MRAFIKLAALVALLAGCSSELSFGAPDSTSDLGPRTFAGAPNITQLAGDLLLHEFPAAGHAIFTVTKTLQRLADLNGGEPFSLPFPTVRREGQCRLYLQPRCTPDCDTQSFCINTQVCTPLVPALNLDIDEVRITGSLTTPLVRLWFLAPQDGYQADPPPGTAKLYAGGEKLTVSGGSGAYVLHTSVTAPIPVVVSVPDPAQPFHLPVAEPLAMRWEPAGAAQVVISLNVSRQDLGWGTVRCLVPDSGEFTVPASLLSALPPPPRSIHYELERDEEVLQPLPDLGPDVGMLVHAAFTAWQNGTDPG